MAINRVTVIGRTTADTEVRDLPGGTKVARVTLAVNEFIKGEERANFFEVVSFGRTAEIMGSYAKKGSQIGVDGSLSQERWKTQSGENRSKVVIKAQRIDLLSGAGKNGHKGKSTDAGSYNPPSTSSANEGDQGGFYEGDNYDPDYDDVFDGMGI